MLDSFLFSPSFLEHSSTRDLFQILHFYEFVFEHIAYVMIQNLCGYSNVFVQNNVREVKEHRKRKVKILS